MVVHTTFCTIALDYMPYARTIPEGGLGGGRGRADLFFFFFFLFNARNVRAKDVLAGRAKHDD